MGTHKTWDKIPEGAKEKREETYLILAHGTTRHRLMKDHQKMDLVAIAMVGNQWGEPGPPMMITAVVRGADGQPKMEQNQHHLEHGKTLITRNKQSNQNGTLRILLGINKVEVGVLATGPGIRRPKNKQGRGGLMTHQKK